MEISVRESYQGGGGYHVVSASTFADAVTAIFERGKDFDHYPRTAKVAIAEAAGQAVGEITLRGKLYGSILATFH